MSKIRLTAKGIYRRIKAAAKQARGTRSLSRASDVQPETYERCIWGQFWYNLGVPDALMEDSGAIICIPDELDGVRIPGEGMGTWDDGDAQLAVQEILDAIQSEELTARINTAINRLQDAGIELVCHRPHTQLSLPLKG